MNVPTKLLLTLLFAGSFYYAGMGCKRDKKRGEQLLLEAAYKGDETAVRLAKEYKLISKDIKHKIL